MSKKTTSSSGEDRRKHIRKLVVTAMFSAVAFILMFIEFSVPLMPSFIKLDISELPALIAAFAYGPLSGVAVCLVKNLLHLFITSTGGVGELSNFILGAVFVYPAGLIYRKHSTRAGAFGGAMAGAALMAVLSVASNALIVYPVYYNFMPKEVILGAYQAIFPGVHSILQSLIVFNMPFTFVKGVISVVFVVLFYNRIIPVLRMEE